MNDFPVYKEPISVREVTSNQSKLRMYHVCFGEVDWGKNGNTEYAIYIRVLLLKNRNWHYQNYPAHILVTPDHNGNSDFDNIMEELNFLKNEHLSNDI